MRSPILVACLALSGCAASGEPPADPSAAPAECTATVGGRLPAGWVDTGATLRVTVEHKKPTAMEGRAADGSAHPITLPVGGNEKEVMAQEICRLGGLLGVVDRAAAKTETGEIVVHVAKPSAPSEKADLALFCAGPPDPRIAGAELDPSQLRTLAMLAMPEVLTTARWRTWIVAQGRRVRAAEGPAKEKIYTEMVAELRAAGAPEGCWFAKAVLGR
jgi:hypothetical protein